jgi:hypothetical protein
LIDCLINWLIYQTLVEVELCFEVDEVQSDFFPENKRHEESATEEGGCDKPPPPES